MERVRIMKWKNFLYGLLLCSLLSAGVLYHSQISEALLHAGRRCIFVIVPALYLFSILAALCIRTGFLEVMARPLHGIARHVFHMDGQLLMILLFSQVGGYPVGAQLLHQLHIADCISPKQERMLLCICVSSGPAFLLGTVCSSLGLQRKAGLLLMGCVTLPNLLLALVMAPHLDLQQKPSRTSGITLTSRHLAESVESGAAAMWKICSMILLFAALTAIAEASGVMAWGELLTEKLLQCSEIQAESWLSAILEISCVSEYMLQGGSLPWAAALLSFGGICVHFQLAAICEGNFSWGRFWCSRLLTAAAAYWLCKWSLGIWNMGEVPTVLVQESQSVSAAASDHTAAIWCLLAMSALLFLRHDRMYSLNIPKKSENANNLIDKIYKMRYNRSTKKR